MLVSLVVLTLPSAAMKPSYLTAYAAVDKDEAEIHLTAAVE